LWREHSLHIPAIVQVWERVSSPRREFLHIYIISMGNRVVEVIRGRIPAYLQALAPIGLFSRYKAAVLQFSFAEQRCHVRL
jgi:hypothetical protein